MVESRCRAATWGVLVSVLAVCLLAPRAGDALDLRVQARSQLTLQVRTAGTHLLISGELRDELGQPLPQREVRLEVVRRSDDVVEATQVADTNRSGVYESRAEVPPGDYEVRAVFEATPHVTSAQAKGTVRVEGKPVDLQVRGPSLVRSGAESVPIRIRASVEGRGISLPVEVQVDNGTEHRMRVDDRGRGRVDVADWLSAGANRISVIAPGGPHRPEARQEFEVRVADAVEVEASLEAVFERLQRGAAVTGQVRAEGQPVPETAVEVRLVRANSGAEEASESEETEPLRRSGRTDEEGQFHLFFPRNELPDGEWRARVQVRPDIGASWVRDVGTLEIDRTLSRIVVDGAAGLAILAVLFVAGREGWRVLREKLDAIRRERRRTERRRQAFEEEATLEPVSMPEEAVDEEGGGLQHRVRGQVWDSWRDEPVEGAAIEGRRSGEEEPARRSTTGSEGRFGFDELDDGDWELVVEAEYFVRGRLSFEIPHDGSLDPCRFELVPVPLKIRRLYQSLIEMAAGDDLWGELSPREIRETVERVLDAAPAGAQKGPNVRFSERIRAIASGEAGELETGQEYLETLTELVEETYFGPRQYGEATWQLARRIAVELREEMHERVG